MSVSIRSAVALLAFLVSLAALASAEAPSDAWTHALVMALCIAIARLRQPRPRRIFAQSFAAALAGTAAVVAIRVGDMLTWQHASADAVIGLYVGEAIGRLGIVGGAMALLVWIAATDREPLQPTPGGPLS